MEADVAAPQNRNIANCSFCLQQDIEVNKLIAGPGVYICDRCVALCNEILQMPQGSGERLAPWEPDMDDATLLMLLPKVAATISQADRALTEWVAKARHQGISWARIGTALGITRQSAWERFSNKE